MKIEVNENIKKRKYPWVGRSIDGQIVFFFDNKKGITLNNVPGFKIGEFFESWNEDFFEPFTGTITLSND